MDIKMYEIFIWTIGIIEFATIVITNGFMLTTFAKNQHLLTPMNWYYCSMSLTGLVAGFLLPFGIGSYIGTYAYLGALFRPCVVQKAKYTIFYATAGNSIYCMLAIAIQRWRTMNSSTGSSRYRGLTPTVKVAKVWILVGWATSVAYATTLSSITDSKEVPIEYEDQPLLNSCFVSTISNRTGCEDHLICYPTNRSIKQMEIFHVTTLILFFLVPMFTISLIYYRLVLRLLSQRSSGPSSNTHQAKLRAIQAMVLIVIIFAVCWLPGHIYVIWMFNINAAHSAPIVYRTSVVGRMLNDFVTHLTFNHHWIHTLIYTHYSRQITAAVSQTLGTIIPLATRMTQTRDQPNIGPAVTASM